MPVTASLIGGGVGLVGGLIKGLVGGKQKREGKKILSGLQYPDEQVPTEITNAAATGLPSEQYQQAQQNIQQQQLMALRNARSRRAGIASIPGIQNATNSADLNLDVANANARQKNLNTLASWKDKVWQNNVKGKYQQQYNYGMGLVGQGNQNLYGGIDQGVASVGQAANGILTGGRNNYSGYRLGF